MLTTEPNQTTSASADPTTDVATPAAIPLHRERPVSAEVDPGPAVLANNDPTKGVPEPSRLSRVAALAAAALAAAALAIAVVASLAR